MSVRDAVRTLRSTRSYALEPITDEQVEQWIDAARWCGSSKNTQPWRFIAIRDRATLHRLADLGHHSQQLAGCAVAIAVAMRRLDAPVTPGLDLGRVAQSLMLLAHEDGYGSCIAILEPAARIATARALLDIPDDHDLDLIISFGRSVAPTDPAPTDPAPAGARVSPPGRLETRDLLSWERFGRKAPT